MHKIILSSLLLTGFSNTLQAQENNKTNQLPEMVVTATRSESAKETLATASTIYTRQDIERLQVQSLPDLLRGSTGLDVVQSGGYGKSASIFMRGTNSDHVLVLVDGIKIGSATLGATPFEFVPVDQIERVEIIRGPQSSLYGSEAVGGVIQIFTRKGNQSEKPSITLNAGGGNYDTIKAAGSVSGKWRDSWYAFGASHINTQGFNARQPVSFVDQPDNDGYDNTSVNARLGHRFNNNAEIEGSFTRSEGKNEYDNFEGSPDKTKFITQVAALSGSMDILKNWQSTLRLGQSFDDNDQFVSDPILRNKPFYSRFNSTRWNQSWLNEVSLSDEHKLIIGQDFRLDEIESTVKYQENSRYDLGGFVEYHGQFFDDHHVNASIRGDENEAFGSYVTGNFSWRYNGKYGVSPFASFGNAFKAPSFNDLYWPNDGFSQGNPNLKPEESTSFEVGLAGNHDWLQWEIRAYHTNIDNLINWVLVDPVNFKYRPENVNKAQIDGVEAEFSTQLFGWNSKLSLNLLSPVDRTANTQLARRAQKTLAFDLSRSFGPVDVGANVFAQDHRYDDPANTINVDGYVTVDLRSAYHFNKNWTLSAKLNNLLDKQYQTVSTYNTADRNFFVSIHYNN